MLSLLGWPKVITLSGLYCIWNLCGISEKLSSTHLSAREEFNGARNLCLADNFNFTADGFPRDKSSKRTKELESAILFGFFAQILDGFNVINLPWPAKKWGPQPSSKLVCQFVTFRGRPAQPCSQSCVKQNLIKTYSRCLHSI